MNDDIIILEKKIDIFNNLYNKYKTMNFVDETDLKEIVCDILGWFEICLKNTHNLNKIERKKISGIRHANNVKKHSKPIFEYTLQTYALFPSEDLFPSENLFPSDFNIFWISLPLDDPKFTYQFNCYKLYFEEQDLYSTINEVFNIIKNHFE